MVKTGTETEVIPERTIERDTKVCDICGENATGKTPCDVCKKDLCGKHQIDTMGNIKGNDYSLEIPEYIFCKKCLLEKIQEVFPD